MSVKRRYRPHLSRILFITARTVHVQMLRTNTIVNLVGVEIQNEFVYPLEDAFTMYLADYFNDSLFVSQGTSPSSPSTE